MSKIVNPAGYRTKQRKNWDSKSFFEKYNYSKVLYQDLYIQDYIENFMHYNIDNTFIHNIIVQRKLDNIHVFLDYYRARVKKSRLNKRDLLTARRIKFRNWWKSGYSFKTLYKLNFKLYEKKDYKIKRTRNRYLNKYRKSIVRNKLDNKRFYLNKQPLFNSIGLIKSLKSRRLLKTRKVLAAEILKKYKFNTNELNLYKENVNKLIAKNSLLIPLNYSFNFYFFDKVANLKLKSEKILIKNSDGSKKIKILKHNNLRRGLSYFSLKRLLVINLMFLSRCSVKLHSRNITNLERFPRRIKRRRKKLLKDYELLLKKEIVHNVRLARAEGGVEYFRRSTIQAIKRAIPATIRLKRLIEYLKDSSNRNGKRVESIEEVIKSFGLGFFVPRNLKGIQVIRLAHAIYFALYFRSPRLLAYYLGESFIKNIKQFHVYAHFLTNILGTVFNILDKKSLKGVRIQFKGRLGRSLRKKKRIIELGLIPTLQLGSNVEYFFHEVVTIYGVCSIKIWFYCYDY